MTHRPAHLSRPDRMITEALPLGANYFGPVSLPLASVRAYQSHLMQILDATLARSRKERIYGGVDDSWRDIGSAYCFKRFTKAESGAQHYRLQGVVPTAMANIMGLLYADHDAEVVARRKVLFGNALDAQTLAVLRPRTPENRNEHMTIRWEAMKFSIQTDELPLDTCGLEYTGVTLDHDDQPIGFKIFDSIEILQCPSLSATHGLTRAECRETILLRPMNNGSHTEVVLEGSLELTRKVPTGAISNFLSAMATCLAQLPMAIQARRLASLPILDRSQLVPPHERKNCGVCLCRFGILSKKRHCRSCGEVICKACVVKQRRSNSDVKFCKKCVLVACQGEQVVFSDRSKQPPPPPLSPQELLDAAAPEIMESFDVAPSCWNEQETANFFIPIQQSVTPHNSGVRRSMSGVSQYKPRHRDDEPVDHFNTYSITSSSSTTSSVCSMMDPRNELDDAMVYLDTKKMARVPSYHEMPVGTLSSQRHDATPILQDVEDSIAQQRYLLQEMITQASKSYRPTSRLQSS